MQKNLSFVSAPGYLVHGWCSINPEKVGGILFSDCVPFVSSSLSSMPLPYFRLSEA